MKKNNIILMGLILAVSFIFLGCNSQDQKDNTENSPKPSNVSVTPDKLKKLNTTQMKKDTDKYKKNYKGAIPLEGEFISVNEIITLIEKFGEIKELPVPYFKKDGQFKEAINMGINIADGFVYVGKYWDTNKLKDYADKINSYADSLNVKSKVTKQYEKVIETINKNDKSKLHSILRDLRDSIAEELQTQKNNDAVYLGYMSGYMEGLYIAAKSLKSKFDQDSANKIFRYKVSYLKRAQNSLSNNAKTDKNVKDLLDSIKIVTKIIEKPSTQNVTVDELSNIINLISPVRKNLMK